jgi:hypothetical protein
LCGFSQSQSATADFVRPSDLSRPARGRAGPSALPRWTGTGVLTPATMVGVRIKPTRVVINVLWWFVSRVTPPRPRFRQEERFFTSHHVSTLCKRVTNVIETSDARLPGGGRRAV